MRKFWLFLFILFMNACTTEYVWVDDAELSSADMMVDEQEEYYVEKIDREYDGENLVANDGRLISMNDVFVVSEGDNFVTYQYKNVRVDEISPLASLYCDDVAYGRSPYLREVNMFYNGFMRATFDCVSLAI